MNELWLVGVVAGGAGAAVGGPLVVRGWRESDASERWTVQRLTGAWILGAAISMLIVGIRHGGLLTPVWDLAAEQLTDVTGLIAWPVLVTIARRVLGLEPRWLTRTWHHLVPAAIYVAYLAATGWPDVPFLWLLPVSFAGVAGIGISSSEARGRAPDAAIRHMRTLFVFSAFFALAQTLRSLFPDAIALRDIAPAIATVTFFAMAFALGAPGRHARATYRKSGLTPARARELVTVLDDRMASHAWFREPDLALASLAARIGVTAHALSQSLNQQREQTLLEYLTEWRLRDARQRLLDPSNDCYTVEGVARQSGFASRSAFYAAFKRAEGVTPTEFRETNRSAPFATPVDR